MLPIVKRMNQKKYIFLQDILLATFKTSLTVASFQSAAFFHPRVSSARLIPYTPRSGLMDSRSWIAVQRQHVQSAPGTAKRGVETTHTHILEKKIQTLFLEMVENPPQLHHMTFRKENATPLSANPRADLFKFPQASLLPPASKISKPHVIHHTHVYASHFSHDI